MRRYFVCDLIWNWYDRPTPIYVLETSEELTIEEFKKIAKDIFPAPTKWGWVNVSFYTEEELEEEVKNLIRRDLTLFTAWDSEEDLSAFVEWKYEEWLEEAIKNAKVIKLSEKENNGGYINSKEV